MHHKPRVVFNRKFDNVRVRLVAWGWENYCHTRVERSENTDAMGHQVWIPADFILPQHRHEFMRALGAFVLAKKLRASNQN